MLHIANIETIYKQRFNDYSVVVQEYENDKFDVMIFPVESNVAQVVETVSTRHHALRGAERLHIFYDIAISKGYRLEHGSFKDNHGNELHASYAMDLDATVERFSSMLI